MRPSSVIMLTRGHGAAIEVFWSQRQHTMTFLGGFWAFVGGSVEDSDTDVPLHGQIPEGYPDREFYGCAARELFEELGLWVGRDGLRHVSNDPELRELRARLADGEFDDLATHLGEVDTERLLPVGRWETPDWFDTRFDSEFFAVALTADENATFGEALADHLLDAELLRAEWTQPRPAIDAWARGERLLTLPIRQHLEALDAADDVYEVDIHSSDIPHTPEMWEAVPGIVMLPLRTPTIPPATHTNCYLVGEDDFVIIDPGSPNVRDQAVLDDLVQQMLDAGRRLLAVVLTHHHPDHILGVEHLIERFGCPVWAHAKTATLVDFEVQHHIEDQDELALGRDSLTAIFTPGHASGHLAFLHPRTNALLGGDLIASSGTILVNPPDGHLGDYLASLALVRDMELSALYPAHGWTVSEPAARLQHYIEHRLAREDKVLKALEEVGAGTAMDVVPIAYADTPEHIWPIAARSAQAHLIHLAELGRVSRDGERFSARASNS